jgi:predicted metal-dependent HD superfamily phosphohydrolase
MVRVDRVLSHARLEALVADAGGRPGRDVAEALAAAYCEPHRHYHTARHVASCLRLLGTCRALAHRPEEVALGIYFHDAVYDTHRNDNASRSAAWAARWLRARGVAAARVARVTELILATRHEGRAPRGDAALLVDIDLSVLGRAWTTFSRYDTAIRREYAWVPLAEYRVRRARVLRAFLDRPRIYSTAALRARFERQARRNLAAAIALHSDASQGSRARPT